MRPVQKAAAARERAILRARPRALSTAPAQAWLRVRVRVRARVRVRVIPATPAPQARGRGRGRGPSPHLHAGGRLNLDEEGVAGRAAAARAVLGALERDEDVVPVARVVDVVHVALLDAPLRQRLAPAHLHREIPQASTRAFPVSGLAVLAGRRPDSASQPAALAAQARLLFHMRCARAA